MAPRNSTRVRRLVTTTEGVNNAAEDAVAKSNNAKKVQQSRRGRVSRTRSKSNRTANLATSTEKAIPRASLRQKRKKQPRPPVINLDVTFSSASEEDSDFQEVDSPLLSPIKLFLSERANDLGVGLNETKLNSVSPFVVSDTQSKGSAAPCIRTDISDSSDSSDCEIYESVSVEKENINNKYENYEDLDPQDDADLYDYDFKADRQKVFNNLQDVVNASNKTKLARKSSREDESSFLSSSDLLCDESTIPENSSNDLSLSLDVSSVLVKPPQKARIAKRTREALKSLQTFSKRFQQDIKSSTRDHEISACDIILSDDEEYSEINVKIRWGTTYLKIPVKKDKKFLVLYQQLAEKYNVSISQVVLSLRDCVLSPDLSIIDSGISIADILEGGLTSNKNSEPNDEGRDMISLKLQSSNKKDSTTMSISKFDKMLVLMQNYAASKNVDLKTLKFKFDGEILNPDESACDLDLEGGECIDVFYSS